jgi:hypothetical protein
MAANTTLINQQRAGEIKNAGIEHRTGSENGSHNGITDETHIAECQHETVNTAVGQLDGQIARKQKG